MIEGLPLVLHASHSISRRTVAALVALTAVVSLTACGSDEANVATSSDVTTAATSAADGTTSPDTADAADTAATADTGAATDSTDTIDTDATAAANTTDSTAAADLGDAPAGTPTGVEDGAYPVTIDTWHGPLTIDAEPQRVVTLGLNDQDFVLAFGVQPVAATYWNGAEDDATQVWTDGIVTAEPEVLNMPDGLNLELIAAAEPDLIVAMFLDVDDATYADLSAIAPTLVRSDDFADYGVPWQETTRVVGAALGRPARARQMVDSLEARFASEAADHPEWAGRTFAFLDFYEDQIGIYRSDEPRSVFFETLGFEVPAAIDTLAGPDTWGQVSVEQAEQFDLDVLLWRANTPEIQESITSNALIAALPAMQDGRVVWISSADDAGYAFAWGTILSLPAALDGLVPRLEAVAPAA